MVLRHSNAWLNTDWISFALLRSSWFSNWEWPSLSFLTSLTDRFHSMNACTKSFFLFDADWPKVLWKKSFKRNAVIAFLYENPSFIFVWLMVGLTSYLWVKPANKVCSSIVLTMVFITPSLTYGDRRVFFANKFLPSWQQQRDTPNVVSLAVMVYHYIKFQASCLWLNQEHSCSMWVSRSTTEAWQHFGEAYGFRLNEALCGGFYSHLNWSGIRNSIMQMYS